jgi:hypothetical protein
MKITIEWEGPFTICAVKEMDDYGLYQIYGEHIIFGKNSLLYIGATNLKKTGRTFSDRFKEHLRNWIDYDRENGKDVSIYIARVSRKDVQPGILADIEAVQIYWHSPPYNAQYIESVGDERKKRFDSYPLEILNEGKHHRLVKRLSTGGLPWY